ncbi:MAG TPA: DNA gyrase subunit A [Firmicutes bacterium]|jgi:DNA gyrase subunit A|nr:DNA gyrase subunit A [Bacillota bacterium]
MPEEKIQSIALHEEVKSSFLDYAMSVIVSRALPDVRDGLKPVHRRILYAMQDLGLTPDKSHKKSARLVGEVLGKYHPHGDTAVYDAMVRMAQDFNSRYPLVDGQGNYGSMDGDAAAAMRYTETRLTPLAMEMLRDLDKETVDFGLNFDESLREPVVLPSRFPNLLANGSSGIAVGMATNIPPHNLTETIDAINAIIENPDISIGELLTHIKGPDFPTGGIILGLKGIEKAYTTGRGTIKMRGKTVIEKTKEGRDRLLITEIPFQQNKARLMERIANLAREKKIDGLAELRDESDRDGVRIVMELRKGANPRIILNRLYKFTPLQQSFGIIFLALIDGKPKIFNLKEMLSAYLGHQKEIVTRRSIFLLRKAKDRAHIVEGLRIALDNLDRIIALIRGSADVSSARQGLMQEFDLSEKQAQAILDMRLQRLTALERQKLDEEYRSLMEEIAYLEALLSDETLILREIKRDLSEVREKFGDQRKTKIVPDEGEIDLEDLIPEENVVITLTNQGYVKRILLSTYRSQHRGGRGMMAHGIRDGDFVEHVFVSSTRDQLLCFSSSGKVYPIKVYEIPEAGRLAKGTAIINLLPLESGEYITAVFMLAKYGEKDFIIMATQKGIVKKTRLSEYAQARRSGLIALALKENDELISVKHIREGIPEASDDVDVLLATAKGQLIRFSEEQLRPLGRTAQGVKGITLNDDDQVVSMNLVSGQDVKLLLATEKGFGKRTRVDEFRAQNRGGKGTIALRTSEVTGSLCGVHLVTEKEEFIIISARGNIIRGKVSQVPIQGRYARGVTLIRLSPEDKVGNIAVLSREQ